MTYMKKFASLLLSLALILSLSITSFAAEPSILSLANDTIAVSETTQENGVVVSTYENLDEFICIAKARYPSLSDYDLAKFIIDFTGQDSAAVPEKEALMMLEYDNISVSTSFAKVDNNGFSEIPRDEALIAPLAIWDSADGYMRLDTGFTKTSTSGTTKKFNVWVIATWLKYCNLYGRRNDGKEQWVFRRQL